MADPTLLQKYDAVLNVLHSESGKSPSFDDILGVLGEQGYNIHWGEVMDILITMEKDGYIYQVLLTTDEKKLPRYLLGFTGKLLKETGGLEQKIERDKEKELLSTKQLISAISGGGWTKWNILIGLIISGTTLSVVIFNCNRETNRYRRELELQSKDTLKQGQINRSVLELTKELHRISLSLSDTSNKQKKN